MKKKIFIIAGEASGDMLGASLLAALKSRYGAQLEIRGIGGEKMQAQGLQSVFPIRDIAVMGFVEILPHFWKLLCRIKDACEAAGNFKPDILITIDSPGFNFRVVKWLRKCFGSEMTFIHYVAPTVWAYKPERAERTSALFDHMMVLLPFEPRYFAAYGLKTTFVGHPAADHIAHSIAPSYDDGQTLKLVLFPGSRKAEVKKLLPVFKETVAMLARKYPDIQISLPATHMMLRHIKVDDWEQKPVIVLGAKARHQIMQQTHIALTKTGTVTLEIARYGVPMVACYKVHSLTAAIVGRLLNLPFVNLLNIINGQEIIPEKLQEECTPQVLYDALVGLIERPAQANRQAVTSMQTLQRLQHPDGWAAGDAAANVVAQYL